MGSAGMSELEEGLLAGEIDLDEKQVDSGSGMSLSVAQPLVREWLAKRRANLRPVGTFFNTANFQVPPSAGRLSKRLVKNVDYFQSSYVLVFLILVLYCLISSLLLIVIAGAGGAAYFASIKNETRKIAIAGHDVTLAQQYAAIATASIPFFLLAGAGGVVFWVLGASLFFITAHAAFYNYDALEVPEDQEQLVGAIVEEV